MPSNENLEPDWKVFRKDTEAGRLLSRLYGTNVNHSQGQGIRYPNLKKKERDLSGRSRWNSGLQEKQRYNILEKQKRAASLRVPKVGKSEQQHQKQLSIQAVPRRRTGSLCKKTIEENRIMNKSYRPPNQVKMSSDQEKEKLCEHFERQGGKCLPLELTLLPRKKEDEKTEDSHTTNGPNEDKASVKSAMANQIVLEIQERRAFQSEMEINCAGADSRETIVDDISNRMRELMKYDPNLARKLMKDEG